MYAIVEIAGMQYKVSQGRFMYVPHLKQKEGDEIFFDKIFLLDNMGKITIGFPIIQGIKVKGKILKHLKADKVIVFKKKRRKGYKLKRGHRQEFTKVEILSIELTVKSENQNIENISIKSPQLYNKQNLT